MFHATWKPYSSGEVEVGDVIQLAMKTGTFMRLRCPVCMCFMPYEFGKECGRCHTRYDKTPDGYIIHHIGERN